MEKGKKVEFSEGFKEDLDAILDKKDKPLFDVTMNLLNQIGESVSHGEIPPNTKKIFFSYDEQAVRNLSQYYGKKIIKINPLTPISYKKGDKRESSFFKVGIDLIIELDNVSFDLLGASLFKKGKEIDWNLEESKEFKEFKKNYIKGLYLRSITHKDTYKVTISTEDNLSRYLINALGFG